MRPTRHELQYRVAQQRGTDPAAFVEPDPAVGVDAHGDDHPPFGLEPRVVVGKPHPHDLADQNAVLADRRVVGHSGSFGKVHEYHVLANPEAAAVAEHYDHGASNSVLRALTPIRNLTTRSSMTAAGLLAPRLRRRLAVSGLSTDEGRARAASRFVCLGDPTDSRAELAHFHQPLAGLAWTNCVTRGYLAHRPGPRHSVEDDLRPSGPSRRADRTS